MTFWWQVCVPFIFVFTIWQLKSVYENDDQGFWNWLPRTHASQLRTSTCHTSVVHRAYTQMICCCCSSKICWWWAASIFGGQVKFEILVAQGQPHHFWISETLMTLNLTLLQLKLWWTSSLEKLLQSGGCSPGSGMDGRVLMVAM
jgi:hypothetical protein